LSLGKAVKLDGITRRSGEEAWHFQGGDHNGEVYTKWKEVQPMRASAQSSTVQENKSTDPLSKGTKEGEDSIDLAIKNIAKNNGEQEIVLETEQFKAATFQAIRVGGKGSCCNDILLIKSQFMLNKTPLDVLFDTGSGLNLIDSSVLSKMDGVQIIGGGVQIQGVVAGSQLLTEGEVTLHLSTREGHMMDPAVKFMVVRELPVPVILGKSWMKSCQVILDMGGESITFPRVMVAEVRYPGLVVERDWVIGAAGSEVIKLVAPCAVSNDRISLVEWIHVAQSSALSFAMPLGGEYTSTLLVTYVNQTEEVIKLKKGEVIGSLISVTVEDFGVKSNYSLLAYPQGSGGDIVWGDPVSPKAQAVSDVWELRKWQSTQDLSQPVTEVNMNTHPPQIYRQRDCNLDDIDSKLEHMNEDEKIQYLSIFKDHPQCLPINPDQPGVARGLPQCCVDTGGAPPQSLRYRPTPHALREQLYKTIRAWIAAGIIEEARTPWGCPLVWVRRPDGRWRVCADLRAVNLVLNGEEYPLPPIMDMFSALSKAERFTVMDMQNGFHQLHVNELDKHKLGFICEEGTFVFTKMPFGLKHATSVFQRAMSVMLAGLVGVTC
jgi:hypothetical protein